MKAHRDIYQEVTNTIIAELEAGAAPWVKPWTTGAASCGLPYNASTKAPYSGVNILLLWDVGIRRGYTVPAWMTYRQAQARGANVRKGEKGAGIVFTKRVPVKGEADDDVGEDTTTGPRMRGFLKHYTVFNVAQIDGLPEEIAPTPQPLSEDQRIERAEAFIAATGADIRHGGDKAYYAPHPDFVALPFPQDFTDAASYYATANHELGHWTGHKSRLDRDFSGRFGDQAYAAEELVAELTCAFVCAALGIQGELRHAGYIESWLKLLKSDKRAIFTAASKASAAADFLLAFSAKAEAAA